MWLLMVIHLQFAPVPHVIHAEMVETFAGEQKCTERINSIMARAKEAGRPVPEQVNMGCVPLNGRNAERNHKGEGSHGKNDNMS
jgi:hypothetical protein